MKKKFYIFLLLIIIILSAFLVYENYSKTETPQETPSPKEPSAEEKKLLKLDNIHNKVSFFKIDYLDRYLNYKEKNPTLSNERIVVNVNIGLDKPFFKDPINSIDKHKVTVIANKYYFLGSDYVPKELTTISSKCAFNTQKLVKEAALSFEKLCDDVIKSGLQVKVQSSYRSYNYQKNIYNNYVKNSGQKSADTYSARPGFSEHQTGLVVDIGGRSGGFLQFGKTKEFAWMKNNAHKYGFILRYTEDYIPITGYISEPWHYRYVGVDIATYIHENPMTYEEYFVRFIDK